MQEGKQAESLLSMQVRCQGNECACRNESKTEDCQSLWLGEDCMLAFTLLKIIVCSNKLCPFTSQPFVSFLHCMYNMHNTRPNLCMQPCKQDEWGERVLSMWVTLGF